MFMSDHVSLLHGHAWEPRTSFPDKIGGGGVDLGSYKKYHFDEAPSEPGQSAGAEMQTQLETALLWDSIMFRVDTGDVVEDRGIGDRLKLVGLKRGLSAVKTLQSASCWLCLDRRISATSGAAS